ncbi:Phosphonate ABC transporter phosphate-binding periplasmic component [Candidatus Burkholderia verschuerenii]|uniref:Phosphonate ABC transporter phosphate-binding periplasmic component n=1 Tax=Candidatus Burkholderia verschuerenii TaxID=242163 RepID=A0A0L0M666_9BURK|nr:LEA type 2 family protein [Candidatus Burkholderia verschuerenii]KND58127.1 Phosphonate ABC transporter phosphate-binding periplasmic component [Candidatus Burkholderia verschuerenii]
MPTPHALKRLVFLLCACIALFALNGCAGLFNREDMRVNVAGIEPLEGQGLEMRFAVKLRVQNPNDAPIDYDGVALDLDLNGRAFASGVSSEHGTVPRFGEAVISVPVTVSAWSVARQALGYASGDAVSKVSYAVRGRLAGDMFDGGRFSGEGVIDFPGGAGALGS